MSTPQPPAVVSTATFGPRERLRGERRRGFVRLFDRGREVHTGLPAYAREDAVVGGERAGVRRGGASPARGGTSVDEHERLLARGAPERVEERSPVAHAFEVGQSHIGRGIAGEVLEVVGHSHDGGVSGRHRAADADARAEREVLERRHDVARLARDPDPACGRIRRHHLRTERRRCGHDALPVRSGEEHARFLGDRRQLLLGASTLVTSVRVAAGHHERGAHSLARRSRARAPR